VAEHLTADHEEILALRRAARAEKAKLDAWFQAFHERLYPRLLDPERGPELIARAGARLEFCELRGTCSRHYIERWRSILASVDTEFERQVLDSEAEWRIALQSNSPFQFLFPAEGAPWLK